MLEQWIKENANIKDGGSVAVINDDVWILPPRCFSNMPGLKKSNPSIQSSKDRSFFICWMQEPGSDRHSAAGCPH